MQELEQAIIDCESELELKNKELSDATDLGNNELILSLSQGIGKIQFKIQDSFEELEEVTTRHDEIASRYEIELNSLEN